jgi:hypothetical protein
MGVPPGNRRVLVSVPEWYVEGPTPEDARKAQQAIHEISGLGFLNSNEKGRAKDGPAPDVSTYSKRVCS